MPLQETSGTASYDGFGGGAPAIPNYIEDVFSTWLYTGTGATQSISNGINLSANGGMVWIKDRTNAYNNNLFDTAQGATKLLHSNTTDVTVTDANSLTAFNTTGFTLGSGNTSGNQVNTNTDNFVSWTFRKQPKFFDVVTYTGDGVSGRQIAHSLGSVPGCIIIKKLSNNDTWWLVYHAGANGGVNPQNYYLGLNSTSAQFADVAAWNNTAPTSTVFTVGNGNAVNNNGDTYVAYLFAHNAGGFGASGTDNVISCGSYTGNGSSSGPTVTLGYEPQWVLIKAASITQDWFVFDNMRGFTAKGGAERYLNPNLSDAESAAADFGVNVTSTGFQLGTAGSSFNGSGETYIYIAIRRGPMKTPTSGTSVFEPAIRAGTGTTATVTSNVSPIDMLFSTNRDRVASSVNSFWDRLRGGGVYLNSNATSAQASSTSVSGFDVQNGVTMQGALITNGNSYPYVNYNFKRAPGFFDEVCYTGTGVAGQTFAHNLGVAPELMIIKRRDAAGYLWRVYSGSLGPTQALELNTNVATVTDLYWNNTAPTASVFTVYSYGQVNASGGTYVAYLFASCPGVSKVGSYTGNGTTQTINCGFTGGARFVLIKRTDASGDWYVYDTARGMTTLVDPYLLLNSTAAESATLGSVTSVTGGFALNASILAAINTNGGSYIFLAIS